MLLREHNNLDRPALISHPSGKTVGFVELEGRANRLAHHFRESGLREGDCVVVVMENNEHIHAVMWAARRIDLHYALINTHLSAAEAADIVENSAAKAVIGSRATRQVCDGVGEYLAEKLPPLRLIADDDAHRWQRYPECVAAAYPADVERLLGSHPSVVEVAVLGVPEEQYDQRLAAFVVLVVCLRFDLAEVIV
jgi:fatty-acyl-CoA synthase